MNALEYLLQVNICLILFYGFYAVLLRNETFFVLNRSYLVSTALLSFFIPSLQSEWIQSLFVTQQVHHAKETVNYIVYSANAATISVIASPENKWTIWDAVVAMYSLGCLIGLGKLAWKLANFHITESKAYSFFKKIKVDEDIENREVVYRHEEVHAIQWHSADVILFEVIAIICWFNPVVYGLRKAVKSIHEFIADEETAKQQPSKEAYATLLVSQAFGIQANYITNSFNRPSLLKRRIIMLHKNKSKRAAILKYGLSAPLFLIMLVFSSATISRTEVVNAISKDLPKSILSDDLPANIEELRQVVSEKVQNNLKISSASFGPLQGVVKDVNGNNLGPVKITQQRTNEVFSTLPNGAFTIPEYIAGDILLFQYPGFKDQSFVVAAAGKSEPKKYGPYVITMLTEVKATVESTRNTASTLTLSAAKPLYIVDGVIRTDLSATGVAESPLNSIKAADIKNISVLKSVNAAAYGEKGKNGVIIITTNKGSNIKDDPLIILDGKPVQPNTPPDFNYSIADEKKYGELLNINPSDIKDISVLKSEAATNVYGEKAKNGVLVINTRQNIVHRNTATVDDEPIYMSVEVQPKFPGGATAWSRFIGINYKYPKEAQDKGVSGRVYLSFIVEKDGSLTNIKIVRDLGFGTGEEAKRILSISPKWSPGMQKGMPVRVAYTLPILLDVASSIKK